MKHKPSACPSLLLSSGSITLITCCHNLRTLFSLILMSMIAAAYCRSNESSAAVFSVEGGSTGAGVEERDAFVWFKGLGLCLELACSRQECLLAPVEHWKEVWRYYRHWPVFLPSILYIDSITGFISVNGISILTQL
jgi:hypothetical protein